MRKLLAFPLLFSLVLAAGCQDPTGSERRSLIGRWTSSGFATTSVEMTLTEVAREVDGAGSWLDPDLATAFRVTGAHADESVSLLLEFEDRPDLNLRAEFTDEDTLVGTLTGGEFRDRPITFVRVDPDD